MNTISNIRSVNRAGVWLTLALMLVATATPAQAMPGGQGGPGGDRFLERIAEKLDLNKTQRHQIKQIRRDNRAEAMALHHAMQDNREALHRLNPGQSDYKQQVAQLARARGDLVRRMIIHHAGVKAQVFAILTPEQRKEAAELARRYHRMGRHHRRLGRGAERSERGAF